MRPEFARRRFSGIDSGLLVKQLISLQRTPILRLEHRVAQFKQTTAAVKLLEANLVSLTTATQSLAEKSTFEALNVTNSDSSQLTVETDSTALPGVYQLQAVRLASTAQALSRGFADADNQSIGTGTIVIANGGHLEQPTSLDVLNSGNGVRRGTIRISDRSGASADINLGDAYDVNDVLDAINQNANISVTASTLDGKIILTDTSGASASDLAVIDLSGGHAAEDLGIAQSVSSATLTGSDVFQVTGDFTLAQINDGNGLRRLNGAPDIRITATDDTTFEVNLDNAVSLNDVVLAINSHEDNGGKVSAAFVNGHLELTATSGGGGSSAFTIEDINNTNVVRQLGLDSPSAGTAITGRRLIAGINSTLLANVRGGQGIDQTGSLTLTDRTGATATIDLSTADSLDQVLNAINSAETAGFVKLQLTARINTAGTGIEIVDTSGSTASNLIVADVGGSTLAAQLGIAVDAAADSVDSGSLNARYVNSATTLEGYAPDGKALTTGSIRITDSAGGIAVIAITAGVKNIGDVIQRINLSTDINVTAQINDTGDGFVLVDEAGGAGTLNVEEVDTDTAADLRLLGDSVVGGDGKQRITSRMTTIIDVAAGDTLNDLVEKINAASGYVTASVFNDGSAFNSQRLRLTSETSGLDGRLSFEDNGLNLGLTTTIDGQDALLRIGGSVGSGFLIASETNTFEAAFTGIDVDIQKVGFTPADVVVTRDDSKIEKALQSFVDGFNGFVNEVTSLTKFVPETEERGILQGRSVVLRATNRLDLLNSRRFAGFGDIKSLVALGIRSRADGTLEFDKEQLADALSKDRQAVEDFLMTEETGFAAVAQTTVESLTDPFTGTFTLESNALQDSIDSLEKRIVQLDFILGKRSDRLLRQFANMENILAGLTSPQQSIASMRPLSILLAGRGIL